LGIPLPLTVVLILFIDLGTDILPALGLAVEKAESDVMKQKPRSQKERLLTGKLLFYSYGIKGMIQAAAGFASYFLVLTRNGWKWGDELLSNDPVYTQAVTAFLAAIIITQIADVLLSRTRRVSVFNAGLFKNRLVLFGILTELILLSVVMYVPFVQKFFGTNSVMFSALLLAALFALVLFFSDEFRKYLGRKGNKFILKYLIW
jgi:sodium/potassium-transporting ATPase subunit alpha